MTQQHQPSDQFASLDDIAQAMSRAMDVILFTVLRLHDDGTLSRIYSSRPSEYPLGGRKTIASDLTTEWIDHCMDRQVPYVGNTKAAVRRTFSDHALIDQLGCESFINAPVLDNGRTVATLCILAGPDAFEEREVTTAQLIAERSVDAVLASAT